MLPGIPSDEIRAPADPLNDLQGLSDCSTSVACFGRARGLKNLLSIPDLRELWISGVPAAAIGVISQLAGLRRLVVFDWRVDSLAALEGFPNLEDLAICQSPKLRRLDGLERATKLTRLVLFDNCNFDDLGALPGLTAMRSLCLEGGFSKDLRVGTLGPLSYLASLRVLRLASIRVADGSLEPLRNLSQLREVFIADRFPKKEFIGLAEALPLARGEFLETRGRGQSA